MKTAQNKFVPQEEEDIDMVFWMKPKEFLSAKRKVYGNILDVIRTDLAKKV